MKEQFNNDIIELMKTESRRAKPILYEKISGSEQFLIYAKLKREHK